MPLKSRYHEDIRKPLQDMHARLMSDREIWIDNPHKLPTRREQWRFWWDRNNKLRAAIVLLVGIVVIISVLLNVSVDVDFVHFAVGGFICGIFLVYWITKSFRASATFVRIFRDRIVLSNATVPFSDIVSIQIVHSPYVYIMPQTIVTFTLKNTSHSVKIVDVRGFKDALTFVGQRKLVQES